MSRKESTIKTAQVNFRIDPETKQMFKDYAKKRAYALFKLVS